MLKDPIVAEIRRYRKEIEHECKGDWKTIFKKIDIAQKSHQKRLVTFKPRRLHRAKVA